MRLTEDAGDKHRTLAVLPGFLDAQEMEQLHATPQMAASVEADEQGMFKGIVGGACALAL